MKQVGVGIVELWKIFIVAETIFAWKSSIVGIEAV